MKLERMDKGEGPPMGTEDEMGVFGSRGCTGVQKCPP